MWKFMQIEPQPARGALREEMWDSPDWIAEEKYDGDRRIAQFCGKIVRFTGRRKSVKDGLFVEKTENVPHLSMTNVRVGAQAGGVPVSRELDGTVLDGEMIYFGIGDGHDGFVEKGGRSKFVTSIMGSLPEEAVRKQIERGWLRYVVFDCLFYKGKDCRKETLNFRRGYAADAVRAWGNPFVSIAERWHLDNKRIGMKEILARGGEGVILKRLDHKYGDKQGWVKVKGEWTADVVIMGLEKAKAESKKVTGETSATKFAQLGWIGAIQCAQYVKNSRVYTLMEVATVSGMDDDLRKSLTLWPKQYIGRVIEIAHNGREPTGRFRHPRFKRFRDDKSAKDCVYREGEI